MPGDKHNLDDLIKHGQNDNKPADQAQHSGDELESALGSNIENLDPNKIFEIARLDTAEFSKKSDVKHAIYGGSTNHIGVIGQSARDTGVYGEGPTGVHGASSTDGDGVVGFGRRGVVGESIEFQGVFGHSQKDCGVVGESDTSDGISGISHSSTKSGVFGNNKNGFGVSGHSISNTGVSGISDNGTGIHGKGGILAGFFEGDVEVTGDIRLSNADCAEDFDIANQVEVEPGTVMVLGIEGALYQSHQPYDKRVAGVISGAGQYKPGIVLDKQPSQNNRQPVALLGKVFCKVDAQYGSVEVGDLLTTSPTLGHAMKVSEPLEAFGAVIGKALRQLNEGQGLIPILITLQ
jgi:hypothetical protein